MRDQGGLMGHFVHSDGNEELCTTFGAKMAAHRQSGAERDLQVDDGGTLTVCVIRI